MRLAKTAFLLLVSFFVGGGMAWFIRGKYDQIFLIEGHFHVVSASSQDHEVILQFPSGKKLDFTLTREGSFNFVVQETGEGSITVIVDDKMPIQVGYVTSLNGLVILVIDEDKTVYSLFSP